LRGGLGRGMRRRGDCHCERLPYRLDHEPHIFVHFVIAEAEHAVAACDEPLRATRIMLGGLVLEVLRSVELHDQTILQADEVDDVRSQRGLSAKLVAARLPRSQEDPQALLGGRGLIAKMAGEVALFAVSVHGETL
jgi:hypothetical protein